MACYWVTGIIFTFFSHLRLGLFQHLLCTSGIPPICHMPHASHSCFDHPNNMWWFVKLTKLLVILTSTFRCLNHSKSSVHISIPFLKKLSSDSDDLLATSPNINLHNHFFFCLSAIVYLIYSLLPYISEDCLLHSQAWESPRCGDRDPLTMGPIDTFIKPPLSQLAFYSEWRILG